jgi:hypothetical protein
VNDQEVFRFLSRCAKFLSFLVDQLFKCVIIKRLYTFPNNATLRCDFFSFFGTKT